MAMDKHEALDWFLRRKSMHLDDKCQAAEDIAIECIMRAIDGDWISVKDRPPEEKQSEITFDFEYVLCATTFGDVRPYKFGTPIGWKEPHFWHGSGLMDEYVTHWMPLPEPPKEG